MQPMIGLPVQFRPHAEHTHLEDHSVLAAVIGRLNADGTADLMVFVPNKEPSWMETVPQGDGSYSWNHLNAAEPAIESGPGGTGTVPEPTTAAVATSADQT